MEPDRRIRRIAVVGGGTAGWTAAAMLNRRLGGHCSIHVVDTPEPLSPGHGEASLPSLLELLRFLGIDQNDFVDKTQATYCLGRRLGDFAAAGESFWHGFGALGALIERRPFYHFWHKGRVLGLKPRLELFSQEISLALANRFIFPTNPMGVAPHLRYALHVDTALVARYLRTLAERAGVIRLDRKVVSATRADDGRLDELQFEDGGKLRADLFVDCTGARAQLIGEFLGVGFEEWSKWLPCDRSLSAPGPMSEVRSPCVRLTARSAGWQWRMPLQGIASVGHVYSSAHQSDDEARQDLLSSVDPLAEPRARQFRQGRRESAWLHNVVAIGESAGFLEPLAGTELHLASNAVFNLLDHFPDLQFDRANIASYNATTSDELERIRDFILLHYCLTRRDDTPFWRHFAALELPGKLAQRLDVYRATGRIVSRQPELFSDLDWFWILEGMGVIPRDYDPLVDTIDYEQVKRVMLAISQKVLADTAAAPSHDSFFAQANARLASARKAAPPAPAAPSPASPADPATQPVS
jgi:tryptophan 7-halogenase